MRQWERGRRTERALRPDGRGASGRPGRRAWRAGSALLLPSRCGGCGDALPPGLAGAWCVHCGDRWGPPPGGWPAGVHGCAGWAAAAYRGPVRRCVLVAKRGAPLAATDLLLRRLPNGLLPAGAVVTWVPGHPLRTVGAPDAGRALAGAVACAGDGLALRQLLRRSPLGRRQAGRTDADRRRDPHRLGLAARPVDGSPVVLVDDVRTTGTTLDHAASLLRDAGAGSVFAITVAVAPAGLDR